MGLELLMGKLREPAECVIKVGKSETEIAELYPFLMEARVERSRAEAGVATLTFESRRDEEGKWAVQDAGVFKPWEPITIAAVFGSTEEEILRGYVREIRAAYPADPGATTVTIECQDASLAFDRSQVRKVWGGDEPTDDTTIVEEIVAAHGLSLHADSGAGLASLTLHQNATDIRFLKDRAEANGYELIFEGEEVYFGPMRLDGEPQATVLVYAGPDTHCLSFNVTADAHQPDQVGFNVAAATGAESVEHLVEPDLAPLGPEPAASGGDLPDFVWRLDRQGSSNEEELLARAQGKANELAMKVKAEGELDGSLYGHVLKVGQPVPVDGVGEWLSGIYYVNRVSHLFNLEGYKQTFTLLRNAYGDNVPGSGGPLAGLL